MKEGLTSNRLDINRESAVMNNFVLERHTEDAVCECVGLIVRR